VDDDANLYGDSLAHTLSYGDALTVAYDDSYAHSDADRHAIAYAFAHSDLYPLTHGHEYADTNPDGDEHADRHPYADAAGTGDRGCQHSGGGGVHRGVGVRVDHRAIPGTQRAADAILKTHRWRRIDVNSVSSLRERRTGSGCGTGGHRPRGRGVARAVGMGDQTDATARQGDAIWPGRRRAL